MRFCKSFLIFLSLSCYTNVSYAMLDALIVSAARTEQSSLTTPASITIISRDEIDDSGAHHVVELLHGRGGIQIVDAFGDGSRSSVGMRGFGETANANTLILVDGRRLNNSDISSPDLNSIALGDVERIEIVQGSAGVLFGDQAVGGVINIITRKPEASRSSLEVFTGSYGALGLHGVTSRVLDNGINYSVSLDLRESDNYRRHNETSYLNGFGKLGYEYEEGSVFAELQYIDDALNTPGSLFANEVAADRRQVLSTFVGDFSDVKTMVERIGIAHKLSKSWSFEGEVTNRDTEGVFRLSFVTAGPSVTSSTQDRKILEFTPRFIGVVPSWNNTMLTLGADVSEGDYNLSSVIGIQINEQSQQSLYAQAVVPVTQALDVTLGARYAKVSNELTDTFTFTNENIDDDITVATFGIAYQKNHAWRFLARVDQNYRFAKVDEYTSAQPFPAPPSPVILKTQEGLSIESGVEWSNKNNYAKFLIYQLKLDNEISFDPVNFININLDETRRSGVITEGHWQLNEKAGIRVSYTYTDAEIINGAFNDKDIPLVAKHSGLISSDFKLSKQWQLYGEVQVQSDRIFSGDFNNILSRLPGYGVANIKAEYALNGFVLSGRVNNVFDKQYTEVGVLGLVPVTFASSEAFFPSPERNFLLTATWQFR